MNEPFSTLGSRRRFFHNWTSLAGFVIAISSLFAFLLLFAIDIFARGKNPYMGILAYVVSPFFLVLGTFLVVFGALRHWRRLRKLGPGVAPETITINFSRARDRRTLAAFITASVLFLLVTAIGSTRTYQYTESVQFCGEACHTPMKPEFTTYAHSPHARVACTECHVGPGATAYVKSKINGVRQLYGALTETFDRPIKTPVKNLRPAQDTCEHCHWPQRFVGNLDRTYSHFLADETNTQFTVRLLLKVGGGDATHGPVGGIHWHMNLLNRVEYIATDEQREVIPWVRVTSANGDVMIYRTAEFKENSSKYPIRVMDCMDCHNRPAHHFSPPNEAVDLAMTMGRINPALPWIKSNIVSVLTQPYATQREAVQNIDAVLREKYPRYPAIGGVISEVKQIYEENFFPEMKADWRAYPNHISHKEWSGCFRCHDGKHKSPDGKQSIRATDCNACHVILAQGNGEQLHQLKPQGQPFFHIDAEYSDFSCKQCHTGAFPKE